MQTFLKTFSIGRFLFALGFLLAWAGGFSPSAVWAGVGDQFQAKGHDLQLFVDYRWAGTARGGYFPIRIQVLNKGPDCRLTFRFEPSTNQQVPLVERRDLPLGSEKKATIILSIPMVGSGRNGHLLVERDGVLLDSLTRPISLSYPDHHSMRSGVLIISPDLLQMSEMERGFHSTRSIPESQNALDPHVIEPIMLPGVWSDYSGLDIVMIPLKTLAGLESAKRTALLDWAETGGTLVIYEVGASAATSPDLQALLNLPEPRHWVWAKPADRSRQQINSNNGYQLEEPGAGEFPPGFEEAPDHRPPGFEEAPGHRRPGFEVEAKQWNLSNETFAYHEYLMGRVYAFRENPFPGTPVDWAWWLSSLPEDRANWGLREGVLPRDANQNFFNFLIPGVTSVPVYAFLVLMTLFTIVIGPLNYIFLRRRKRTYLLLLTIPVIAFVTSLTLFAYSSLSYGFSVTSRSRSLTVLDQRTNTSVSRSRISLFAGLAPSEGLNFSPDTAVYPMWASMQFGQQHLRPGRQFGQSHFGSGRVVWGERQVLADGWLRSRTRTQFATVQHRTERGRLEIATSSKTQLTISNGLEWDIKAIIWADDKGNIYQGTALGAGNTGVLDLVQPANFSSQLADFQQALEENEELEFPDDINVQKQAESGLMEANIQQFLKIKDSENFDYEKDGDQPGG